jgi:hypothetical protein
MGVDIISVFNPPKIELNFCPFCGSKAVSISVPQEGSISGDIGTRTTIMCENRECGAKIIKWALEKEWAEESAVKAWNSRTN